MVHDDGSAVGQRPDRMAGIGRDDRNQSGSGDLSHAVDGDLELALDHLIDLFLRMEVLMDGRAAREVVVSERHARRMEKAPRPAGQALDYLETAGVDKGHGVHSNTNLLSLRTSKTVPDPAPPVARRDRPPPPLR